MNKELIKLNVQRFSGGSYDYLYCKEPEELLNHIHHLVQMKNRLIELKCNDVALDFEQFIFLSNKYLNQATVFMNNTENLLKAIEWRASCDIGDECLLKEIECYRKGETNE